MIELIITRKVLDGGSIQYISKEDYSRIKNSKDADLVMKTSTKYWYDGRPDSKTFGELFQNHPDSLDAILLDINNFKFKK